ncbi:choice-of-anchor Q domain-containing protein [Spirosoma gilvum]
MKNGVTILGGFLGNETILNQRPQLSSTQPSSSTLSGDIGIQGVNTDNCFHVIKNPSSLNLTSVLDGFVITSGNADGSGQDQWGAGVYNDGSGDNKDCEPMFQNCYFQNNTARYGGALFNNGSDGGKSSPQLSQCTFYNNTAIYDGGAIYNYGNAGISSPHLRYCSFQNNTASDGGALYNDGYNSGLSSPQLDYCSFQDNSVTSVSSSGGAVYNLGSTGASSPLFRNCFFQNNSANYGGALVNNGSGGNSSPQLINCSFENNTASQHGGAISNDGGGNGVNTPQFVNCSFLYNFSPRGGALFNFGLNGNSFISLSNCAFWNNGSDNTFSNYISTITARYCLLETSVEGYASDSTNKMITSSPFSSSEGTHLFQGSSAIDIGDPLTSSALVGNTDLQGSPRFVNGRIDVGAYEFQELGQVHSLKDGQWTDPTIWSVGRVPTATDKVFLQHVITIPTGTIAEIKKLTYDSTGLLLFADSSSKLRLGF